MKANRYLVSPPHTHTNTHTTPHAHTSIFLIFDIKAEVMAVHVITLETLYTWRQNALSWNNNKRNRVWTPPPPLWLLLLIYMKEGQGLHCSSVHSYYFVVFVLISKCFLFVRLKVETCGIYSRLSTSNLLIFNFLIFTVPWCFCWMHFAFPQSWL